MPIPVAAAAVGKKLAGHIGSLVGGLGKTTVDGRLVVNRPLTPEESKYMEDLAARTTSTLKGRFSPLTLRRNQILSYGPNEWLASMGIGNTSPISVSGSAALSEAKNGSGESAEKPGGFNPIWIVAGISLVAIIFLIRRK